MSPNNTIIQRVGSAIGSFHRDDGAATATEYIILLILIACFVIAIVKVFGTTVSKKFNAANEKVVKDVTF